MLIDKEKINILISKKVIITCSKKPDEIYKDIII